MPGKPVPLSAGDRARLHSIVAAQDAELAERAVDELDGDPVARAVTRLADDLSAEIRQMRTQVLTLVAVIVSLGMVLQAGMVGVGLFYQDGSRTIQVTPTMPAPMVPVPLPLPVPEPPKAKTKVGSAPEAD